MITRHTAVRFYVGDQEFNTMRDAQMAELDKLTSTNPAAFTSHNMLENAARIVDILTTTETSLSKARKINGGRKVRKSRTTAPVSAHANGDPVTTTA